MKQISKHSTSIVRRFWGLLGLILVFALVSSGLTVWLTANPFLTGIQKEAISEQAEKDASALGGLLAEINQFAGFIARQPDVISVALGYVESTDGLIDYLEAIIPGDRPINISLFDIFGDQIARYEGPDMPSGVFGQVRKSELIRKTLANANPGGRFVIHEKFGKIGLFMMAIPVRNRDLIEGVLVAEFAIDLPRVFPANRIAESTDILATGPDQIDRLNILRRTATIVELSDYNLAISLVPDFGVVRAAGQDLMVRTVGSLSAVLLLAFGLFALLGRSTLVLPHIRLQEQRQELAELAAVAKNANDAIVVTGTDRNIAWANPAFETMTGYTREEVVGRDPSVFLRGPGTDAQTAAEIDEALAGGHPIKAEVLNYTRDGQPIWLAVSFTQLRDAEGEIYGSMSIARDVTQQRRQQEALIEANRTIEHQALHDTLTGLPNRRALDQEVARRRALGDLAETIVRIDLDHFKYVNDTMGHAAGDHVLVEVSRMLEQETKGSDMAARVGGDEFVLLLAPGKSSKEGIGLATRLLSRIRKPMQYEGKTILVGASFGVASTGDGLLGPDELIVGADAALYEAKDAGRDTVKHYTPALHRMVQDRRVLAKELRKAIIQEEFEPYFQPQIDAVTHEVVGVETLLRWPSPSLGLVMPGDILPVARQLSAIDDIDRIMFRKAMQRMRELSDSGWRIPKISFNVTATQIQSREFISMLGSLEPGGPKICLEVLESVLVEEQTDMFKFSMDQLRELGIAIAIDDFGSGHASVIGLMHLKPDTMKIDPRLVIPATQSTPARQLLRSIIEIARIMDLEVVAEGVETPDHVALMEKLGCNVLQGFAISTPIPISDLTTFLSTYRPDKDTGAHLRSNLDLVQKAM